MTYFFDELDKARLFYKSFYNPCNRVDERVKMVLLATPHDTAFMQKYHAQKESASIDDELSTDGIYFDETIGDNTEPYPYRIFRYFTEYECHDEYLVFSTDCKQYYPCIHAERLFEVEKATETNKKGEQKEVLKIKAWEGAKEQAQTSDDTEQD